MNGDPGDMVLGPMGILNPINPNSPLNLNNQIQTPSPSFAAAPGTGYTCSETTVASAVVFVCQAVPRTAQQQAADRHETFWFIAIVVGFILVITLLFFWLDRRYVLH